MASNMPEADSATDAADSAAASGNAPSRPGWGPRLAVLVVLLLAAGAFVGVCWRSRGSDRSLAESLDDDTLAWLHYGDPAAMADAPQQRAWVVQMLEALGENEAALVHLQQDLGLPMGPNAADEFVDWLGTVRSLDVVFRGVGIQQGVPVPKLIVILEFHRKSDLAALAERLDDVAEREGGHGGAPIHTLELGDCETRVDLWYAPYGQRLLFSLDRRTLEKQLDDLMSPPRHPLLASPDYCLAARRLQGLDNHLWVGPDAIGEVIGLAPGELGREVRAMIDAAGLGAFRGAYAGGNHEGMGGTMGLLLDESSTLYKLLALPNEKSRAPEWLPKETFYLVSIRTGDGRERLDAVLDYIGGMAEARGMIEDGGELGDRLKDASDDLGIDLEGVVAQMRELGLFVVEEMAPENVGLYADFGEEESARRALADLLNGNPLRGLAKEERKIAEVSVTTLGSDVVFAVLGGHLIVMPEGGEQLLDRILRARESGQTLAEDDSYAGHMDRLPVRAGGRGFIRMGALLRFVRQEMGPLDAAFDNTPIDLDTVVGGVTVVVDDGMVELRAAASGDAASPKRSDAGARRRRPNGIFGARTRSRRIADCGNLKQLGTAARMYSCDFDEAYPCEIALLAECGYLKTGKVYVTPGSHTPAPARGRAAEDLREGKCDYVWLGGGACEDTHGTEAPIAFTKPGETLGMDFVNVLFGDGHVQGYPAPFSDEIKSIRPILHALGAGAPAAEEAAESREPAYQAVAMIKLGRHLAAKYPKGRFLVVDRPTSARRNPYEGHSMRVNALLTGLGCRQVVGVVRPNAPRNTRAGEDEHAPLGTWFTAELVDQMVARYRGRYDVLVLLSGLPSHPGRMGVWGKGIPVAVGAGPIVGGAGVFQSGAVCVALTRNPAASPGDEPRPENLDAAFDQRFLLVTPANAGDIAEQRPELFRR